MLTSRVCAGVPCHNIGTVLVADGDGNVFFAGRDIPFAGSSVTGHVKTWRRARESQNLGRLECTNETIFVCVMRNGPGIAGMVPPSMASSHVHDRLRQAFELSPTRTLRASGTIGA
jgi:hypothetical protein